MPEGGFLVKFMNKGEEVESHRCYSVSFDYDRWQYKINAEEPKKIPAMTNIEVVPEYR